MQTQPKRLWQRGFFLFYSVLLVIALSLAACGGGEDENIESSGQATADGKIAFLYFYAADCPFCEEMNPIIDSVEADFGEKVTVTRYDAASDEGKEQMAQFELTETPSYVMIAPDGTKLWSLTGQIHRDMLRQQVQLRAQ